MLMLSFNDNPAMRLPTAEEQRTLDNAITQTMRLPRQMQRLSTVINHCSADFRLKMARWIHDPITNKAGPYAYLMDQAEDAIGSLVARVGVFNLAGCKDDSLALPLVMQELWYRNKRTFEDESLRATPKWLDVDEAHALLAIPRFAQESDVFIRTCRKWSAGIAFWSQSPREFAKLESWPALRSAASTFFFMADPNMDERQYREAFLLTRGECDAIRNLTPKREAYIVQRDIGVSKRVILEVEPEQYVISTSQGREASIRRENFERYGFEVGLIKTMEALGLKPTASPPGSSDRSLEVA
jgi:type IV secretion system protein VirB4